MMVPFSVTGLKTLLFCMVWSDPVKNPLKATIRVMYGLILVAIVFRVRLMTGETISHSLEMQEKLSVAARKCFLAEKPYFKVYSSCFWLSAATAAGRGKPAWQGSAEPWLRPLQNSAVAALWDECRSSLLPEVPSCHLNFSTVLKAARFY